MECSPCHVRQSRRKHAGRENPGAFGSGGDFGRFRRQGQDSGLPADCLGKKVTLRYKEVIIVDIELNRRAYPVIVEGPQGGRYIVPVSEVLAALNAPAPVVGQCPYKVNSLVQVKSLFGRDRYEFGMVVSTEMTNNRVKVLSNHGVFTPSLTDIRVCPKLTEEEIMREIVNCYGSLSPENLTCDGEASRAHVRKRQGELWRFLNILFNEIGQEVSEEEAYDWERKHPASDMGGFFKVAAI